MRTRIQRRDLIILFLIAIGVLNIYLAADKIRAMSNLDRDCPTDNILTIREGGRLGNSVWEYIAVLGIHEDLELTPYVPKGILKSIVTVFKNLSIPAYEETLLSEKCRIVHGGDSKKCKSEPSASNSTAWDRLCYQLKHGESIPPVVALQSLDKLREMKESGQLPSILILPKWLAQQHAFVHVGITRFKQEMKLRDDVRELAEETLKGVKQQFGKELEPTFVGIHVRRTDYSGYLKNHFGKKTAIADLDYYKRAMSRMRELYGENELVFVVVSDDYDWCKKNLVNETEGVYWGGLEQSGFISDWNEKKKMGVSHDLGVLALQNHSIIGYGTYALTGSLLAGGHIIGCNISRNEQVEDNLTVRLCKLLPNCELM